MADEITIHRNPLNATLRVSGPTWHLDVMHYETTQQEEDLARQIAALLRFQSAMTPEMWEELAAIVKDQHDDRKGYERYHGSPMQRALSALDTLRQELQQS